jgi:predicted small metal-binding protein
MKDMHCRDAGMDCGFVAAGETEEQVKRVAAAHLFDAHGLRLTPEVERAIEALIHDAGSEAHFRSMARISPHVSQP